ncbi:MAG: pyridoxal-phosphate dependent enzyme [Chloroflexota bacterium]
MADPTPAPELDLPLADIQAAATRLAGHLRTTPMLGSRTAAARAADALGVRLSDGGWGDGAPRLLVKAEHLQVTGSFKPRGALNRAFALTAEERARGLIAVSAGNHAQAVAYAGRLVGAPVTVVMPAFASRAKAAATDGYGAEVILHGERMGDTFARMEELRDRHGLVLLHPFDDPVVIAGAGTVGLEIVAQAPDVDVVVVGAGGGGLLGGVAAAVTRLRPGARVYGVEPRDSAALSVGLAAGAPTPVEPRSIADGLGAPYAGSWTIALARRHVTEVVLVEEAGIAAGMRFALERMKQLLEPAGAAALGALLAGRIPVRDGETVCVVASGGNVDLDRLPALLALATPA